MLKDAFTLIGVVASFILVFSLLISIIYLVFVRISEFVKEKKYQYQVKHRFDKSPTAKCYCVDCINWNNENDFCDKFHSFTDDCSFCYYAEPKKRG